MTRLDEIRKQFPITEECFDAPDGTRRQIVYLDHGASTHPPRLVVDQYREFIEHHYANIHRGNHYLSQKASDLYDSVESVVESFVDSDHATHSVIFTSNTTTALDIASYLVRDLPGITLTSLMEHHSNDLPHRRRGATLMIGITEDGTLDYDDAEQKLRENSIKLVAVTGASNLTGYIPDLARLARMAHENGAMILVDAAQRLAHLPISMRGTGTGDHIDLLAAAGHKAYAPFGSAFLIAPRDLINGAEPYIPGGGTVKFVTQEHAVWADGPDRHTGGTPNIAGVIALGASLRWLEEIGLDWVHNHELELLRRTEVRIRAIPGVDFLANVPLDKKLGVMSFNIDGLHHESVSQILNATYGIATRNGCFCAHPYLTALIKLPMEEMIEIRRKMVANEEVLLPGAIRGTIGIYNNEEDLDKLVDAVAAIAADPEAYDTSTFVHSAACKESI